MVKAIYTGSFDPMHYGHLDIVERSAKIFDEVVVGIGVNPDKKYTFSLEERLDMARRSLSKVSNVRVEHFQGLTVDYAYEHEISVTVKGVRNSVDFDYEQMLHQVGESQRLGIESFVLFAKPELSHISSGAVKALQKEQGFVHDYVPLYVKQKLEEKMSGQFIVGLTGEIGAGKSYVGRKLAEFGKQKGVEVHNIELDNIGRQILDDLVEPRYQRVRSAVLAEFGEEIKLPNGKIDRQALGEIVFSDPEKLERLNGIMRQPVLVRLRREIYGRKGLILLNAALIAESNMAYLSNNNVLLVNAEEAVRAKRLVDRGYSEEQIRRRTRKQYDYSRKVEVLKRAIQKDNHGNVWIFENSLEEGMQAEGAGLNFDSRIEYIFNKISKDLSLLGCNNEK